MPAWDVLRNLRLYGMAYKEDTFCRVQTMGTRTSLHIRIPFLHIQYKNPRDSKMELVKTVICHCITVYTRSGMSPGDSVVRRWLSKSTARV